MIKGETFEELMERIEEEVIQSTQNVLHFLARTWIEPRIWGYLNPNTWYLDFKNEFDYHTGLAIIRAQTPEHAYKIVEHDRERRVEFHF